MKRNRWLFVDFLRFVAVLMMLQGHTFDAVLNYEIRAESWYRLHAFWHGFTAPLFLFGSGLAFGIATFRKWESHTTWSPALARRLRRYGLLLLIGYALHLPYFSLAKVIGEASPRQLLIFLQSDALHVIAVSLLVAQAGVYLAGSRRRFAAGLLILSLPIIVVAPWLWHAPVDRFLPAAAAAYVSNATGSIFPFFPWSAYLFFGILSAYLLRPWEVQRARSADVARIAAAGMAMMLGGRAWDLWMGGMYSFDMAWNVNPAVLISKTGAIMLFVGLLYQLEYVIERLRRSAETGHRPVARAISYLGQESLAIYVVHLLVLYGSALGPGLNRVVGRTLGVPESTMVFLLLLAAMLGLAWGWQTIKRHRNEAFRATQWAVGFSLIALFVLSPH